MQTLILLGTIAGEIAWTPICVFFVRKWWSRKNPISMAIALGISFIMLLGCAPIWLMGNNVDVEVVVTAHMILNFLIVFAFYIAFYLSARSFPEQRKVPS
jgi:hypothetical protein